MTNASASGEFRGFNAHAIVDQAINYTIVGGRFSPTTGIDLTRQVVTLSVAGAKAKGFRLSLSAGSFRKTGIGGYVASDIRSLRKTDILLQPCSAGDWVYSAGIRGFVPGSTPVTVSLTIGRQAGKATVKVCAF